MNDARMSRAHLRAADGQPLRRAGPETLDDDVRGRNQSIERRSIDRIAQIQRDAFLPAVQQDVVNAAAIHKRRQQSHRIPAARIFNLDHLRAQLREHQRRKCARNQAREIKDANAGEGKRGQSLI